MDLRICRIFKLLRDDGTGRLRDNLLCAGDRPLHALRRRRQHQFDAKQGKHLAALDRHAVRHDDHQPVTARGCHKGERNARVSGGRLHQNGACGIDLAGRLERVDHRHANAILDTRDRVEKLELGEEVGLDATLGCQPVQAHQRRVADRIRDGIVNTSATGRTSLFTIRHGVSPQCSGPVLAEFTLQVDVEYNSDFRL